MLKTFNKKVINNFGWALLGRVFAAILQATGIILLARWEEVENFGIVASMLALGVLVHALIDFGLTTYSVKERSAGNMAHLYSCMSHNRKFATLFGLLSSFITFLLGYYISSFFYLLLPVGVWIAYERQSDFLISFFIADSKNKIATKLLTHRRLLSLVLFIALYFLSVQVTLAYMLAIALAALASYLQVKYLLSNEIAALNQKFFTFKELFSHTFPFWINSFFAQLRNVDVVIVTVILGPVFGALFGVANRVVSPLSMVSSSMATVVLPSVSKGDIRKHEFYKYTVFATALSSIPYICLFFLSSLAVPLLLGEKYNDVVPILEVLSLGLIFFSASSVLGSVMQGVGLQKRVAQVNVMATSIYILFLIPVAYWGGIMYAVYSLCIFFILRLLMMAFYLNRGLKNG
ncbi:MAG: hypothetical protein ISEC1_P0784 [Thiomicrorhabdus sp.]|nr:MAG: hypothetical protein ISEC1_P0784 [Thiomicrorhabdus sp.]